jgi:hypothetical protein
MSLPPLTGRRLQAYKTLGVEPEVLKILPPISSQVRMLCSKLKKRNLPATPYYYLKFSDSLEAKAVVELYYSLAKHTRDLVPLEAYCLAANVSTRRLFEVLMQACASVSQLASNITATINHPAVVEKTVEMALTDEGYKDRVVLHRATGFLPAPKGAQTNITIAQNATASATAQSASVPAPPPEQTIRRAVNRFNERTQPALPASTETIRLLEVMPHEELEAVVVDSEDDSDREEEAELTP